MVHLNNYEGDPAEHIAIIGMTGRFPGAKDLETFWQNLHDGVESIKFFTAAELAGGNLDPALLNNPKYVGADGIIEDMDLFDAEFFNISPSEAELLDPQHRLFLECAWELMEQAGYDSESYEGRVAVYGSANLSTYLVRNVMSNPALRETATSFQTMITNDKDFIATRVSYKLNLRGPSLSVATLCSSSFVAIHLGCQSLLNYQCDLALTGAISLQVSRNEAFFYQEGGIGDPDGHCRAFDAQASGTVSGSGIGLVALKRLEDALKDGDTIHAVIRGAAVNNDGAIKYSYTAPSMEGQANVIAEAISLAEVDPETITYVETHGTGTRLGDPIEVAALTQAFRGSGAQGKQYCAIGSVKTNIGHLVNAGGTASLIKTVLAMQHKQIPPSLNFKEPNPEIDFANSPFYVVTQLAEWETKGFPRRAGVSSFGIGGTNVHLIVEEAPEIEPSGESRPWQLLTLSAKTSTALEKQTSNLVEYLTTHPDANLADVAYTLQVGRRGFEYRRMLLCRDVQDAKEALSHRNAERVLTRFQETKNRPVVFMFPGLGEQHVKLGPKLLSEPTFHQELDACANILNSLLRLDIRQVLYPDMGKGRQAEQQLEQSAIARAALFAVEYSLAKLWMEWGITPQAMIGEGVGEYVAACLADVLSLEDALTLVTGVRQITPDHLSAPRIPFVSGTTGNWITDGEATSPSHWNNLLNQTRSFAESVKPLLKEPEQVLLQVGPGQAWCALVLAHPDKAKQQIALASLPVQPDIPDIESILATLGQLWLAGAQVDWYGFHTHERRHRLPLPTYPFERKRYWVEPYKPTDQLPQVALQPEALTKKQDSADWFYVPSWKTTLLPPAHEFAEDEGTWLLFLDECGVGSAMADRLRQMGQSIVTVAAGEKFACDTNGVYTLNVCQRADYTALFEALQAAGHLPRRIVHLSSITANTHISMDTERFQRAQDFGFNSLLFLAQALTGQPALDNVQLWVASNHTQKVESADVVYPEKATILGLCKVIQQENADVTCHYIDLALPETATQANDLSRHLLAEIGANSPGGSVAYRGRQRWQQTFEPVRLLAEGKPIRPLRQNGVYLITSELGDISLALAEHLARTVQARLVVIENEAFPKRDQWEQWLKDHALQDSISLKIQGIRTLETLGAEVLITKADLTDSAQLQNVLAQVSAHFGELHGVIHAVGSVGDNTFKTVLDTDPTEGIQLFESKMRGLSVLEQVLSGQNLDWVLLVSSLASVLGGVGQAAYAAANIFMDAFATSRGTPWLSINWDAWQFEAEQGRIAALTPALAQFAISPTEGGEVLERILSAYTGDQLVVSTGDLPMRMKHWLSAEPLSHQGQDQKKVVRHPRPNLLTPYVAPTTDMEKNLADAWREALGIDKVGIDDNFFELGGDSLIAVKMITRLEKMLQRKVPAANLYQTPSIRALAALLAQDETASAQQRATQLGERREALSRRNAQLHQRRKG